MNILRFWHKKPEPPVSEPPACADCTHCLHKPSYIIPESYNCMRRVYDERHIVTGKMVTRGDVECHIERGVMGGCGTSGIHFKKKDQ